MQVQTKLFSWMGLVIINCDSYISCFYADFTHGMTLSKCMLLKKRKK